MNDLADQIAKYEKGDLGFDETINLFQRLIDDDGIVWSLQGHYGRTAEQLLEAGLIRHR